MISPRHPGRPVARSVTAAGLALVGLILSGCGSLGIHPGSAAVIGDDTLTMDKIDSTTTLYCQAYLPQLQQGGQELPMHYLRQFVAASLAQRDLGQQLADQYAVQPTSQYQTHLDQVAQQFASAAPAAKQAVLDVEGGDPYLQTIQVAIGQKLLAEAGSPTSSTKAALQRGLVATQDWLRTHKVAIDPVFGVAVDGGAFKALRDQTSYPLSALASAGAAGTSQPDPNYTAALTPAQLCG
jgi:thiol-disulfide isomerase/thioredoxin